eukprot:c25418_g1_i1 orf=234-1235(+)
MEGIAGATSFAAGGRVASSEESCSRLAIGSSGSVIFVKGNWFPSHFMLSITDGLHAWRCYATEEAVANRARGWDESVSEYLERAKWYLGYQQADSIYDFLADGDNRKLSWTMEKHGTKLEAKWKCEMERNAQLITQEILDFLMDANTKLSEEVIRKTKSFEKMKIEAEKCLKQSEVFLHEKEQFEAEIYTKFVAVLNSKKAKLRELHDKLLRLEPAKENNYGIKDDLENNSDDCYEDDDSIQSNNEVFQGEYSSNPLGAKDIVGNVEASDGTKPDMSSRQSLDKGAATMQGLGHDDCALVGIDSKVQEQPVESAADLLAESHYTSAPKRRRRL